MPAAPLLELRDFVLDPLHDIQRRYIARLLNGQQHRPLAVETDDVGLSSASVITVSEISNVNG